MKKYIILLFTLCCFFVNSAFVNADCDSLIKEADKIKVYKVTKILGNDQEVDEDTPINNDEEFIGIAIEGLGDKFYAEVTNDYNDNKVVLKSSDNKNGKIQVSTPYIYRSVKMIVNLYSNNPDSCDPSKVVKSFEVNTDIFNQFYYTNICEKYSYLEECQPTYDNSEYSSVNEFVDDVNKILEEKSKTIFSKLTNFIMKYIWFIIIPIILISIVYITRIIIIKRRNKNE